MFDCPVEGMFIVASVRVLQALRRGNLNLGIGVITDIGKA